jgi:hypothetical protein
VKLKSSDGMQSFINLEGLLLELPLLKAAVEISGDFRVFDQFLMIRSREL